MTALVAILCAVFGLVIGSFLNVVIYRVPRGESIVHPPSHCPSCQHQIAPRDNVPVLSWLLLHGRCRNCGAPISRRYPLVELATGALFAALAVKFGPHPDLPAFLYLGAIGVALTMIDIDVHRLPNSITLPSYPVALVLLGVAAAVDAGHTPYVRALLGMVALFGFYAVIVVVYPAGMGLGDVKLAGVLGLYLGWIGWGALVVGAFTAFLLGGVTGVVLMARSKAGRKSRIAFGPFMIIGAFVGIFVGQPIAHAYLHGVH